MKVQAVFICAVMISAIFADEEKKNIKRGIGHHLGYGGSGFDNGYGFQHRNYPGFSKVYNAYNTHEGSHLDDYDGYYGEHGDYYGGNTGYYGDAAYSGELGYHGGAAYHGGVRSHYPYNYNQYDVGHGAGHHLF